MDLTAGLFAWAFEIWPSYTSAIVLASLLISLLFAPLIVVEVRQEARRMRHARRYRTGDRQLDRAFMLRDVFTGPLLALKAFRGLLQASAAVLVFVTVMGFSQLDPDNGGGPRYLEQDTALWLRLRDTGGELPLGRVDLARSAYSALQEDGFGAAVAHSVIPLALMALYLVRLIRFGAPDGMAVRIVIALAISLLTPGAFVLYLITVLVANTGVMLIARRTPAGGVFVGRS
ncbi:hypothetical protein [Micromonospora sp. CPCC 206061]|uniref:hypothetical protein n=1 Tax=Micromonospora sp. CPCC 206061 TaxID=3122410 RepID=UPI002FF0579B